MAIAHARRGRALPPRMHVGARAPLNLLALWRADAARADPRHPVPRCDAPQFRGVRRTPDARAGGARWGRSALDRAGRAAALAADAPPELPRARGLAHRTSVVWGKGVSVRVEIGGPRIS